MLKRLSITIIALALTVWGVVAFTQRDTNTAQTGADGKLRVVTTNSILEDMTAQVGGDRIELYSIVKRGVDPHEYDPQPRDITATGQADLIFHNGLNLETGGSGWFKKLINSAHKTWGDDVVAASAGVTPLHLTTNKDEQDPHAWLSLANGTQYVRTITKALVRKDPSNAAYYQRRSKAYIAKLTKLHHRAQQQFAAVPANARVLVTSEGAFKYFGKAYAVTPVYIWEINTESQGTPEQMQHVLSKIQASSVKALFVETSVSPKSMEKVAKETGLPIKAKIFTDSLAPKGKAGDTYYGMMQWNIDHIQAGMQNQ
jgi:iron/zinc/copper transport system substrate-binding protein